MNPPWTDRDALDTLRSTAKHENDLINHRLTWLGVINGLLGHLITSNTNANSVVLNIALATAGVAVTLSAWFSLLMAGAALDRQRDGFATRWGLSRLDDAGFGIAGVQVGGADSISPRIVIPSVILGGWALVILLKAGQVPDWVLYGGPPLITLTFAFVMSPLLQRRLRRPAVHTAPITTTEPALQPPAAASPAVADKPKPPIALVQ